MHVLEGGPSNLYSTARPHLSSLTGIGEVVLLPLDVLKIKRQVNPEAFRGRGILKIVSDEGFALYRGWGWTMARNAPGSFAVSNFHFVDDLHLTEFDIAIWGVLVYEIQAFAH
jgi:hypothetical protein